MPVLKTRAALRQTAVGAVLTVLTSDPMSAIDIPHMVSQSGDHLVSQAGEAGGLQFQIRKGGPGSGKQA